VKLADYWVANLHGSYQLSKEVQLYGVVNNLFNRKFATFGTYFNPQVIANAIPDPPTDHRMVTPAQPLAVYIGLRGKLTAADVVPPYAPPPSVYVPPAFTWTGFYLGGNLGAAWALNTVTDTQLGLNLSNGSNNGVFIGGGQLGFNWQVSNVVLGFEWDFDRVANNNNTGNGLLIPAVGTIQVTPNNLGLGSQTFTVPAGSPFLANDTFTVSNRNIQMVKVGINYLFN